MLGRRRRVVQLGKGDPTGEEFGVDLALARREAVAVHGGVGGAGVPLLQGVQEVVAALAPQGVLAVGVRRRSGQGGQQREGLGLTSSRAQQAHPLQHHGRIIGLALRQAADDHIGSVGGAQRHHGVGDSLAIGRDQGDHGARRRAVRPQQQHVQPRHMIVAGQPAAPTRIDSALLSFFKTLGAPPVANQGLGLLTATRLLQRAGQGDGALSRGRCGSAEEGQDGVRRLTRHVQRALARRPTRIAARPVGQVGLGQRQIAVGHLLVRGVDQRPLDQLARGRIGNARYDGLRAHDVARPRGRQPLLHQGGVLAADDPALTGGIGRRRAVQHVLSRWSQYRQGGGHGRRDHQISDPHSSLVAAKRRATYPLPISDGRNAAHFSAQVCCSHDRPLVQGRDHRPDHTSS